jgi:acetyltransferase-like isoleucine patch superfamily enzyme
MIHPSADVQSKTIGEGTRVWQFCVILEGARIGSNCNINAHCFIEGNVSIGDNSTIKSGVYLWDGTVIEDNVFVGPNATFTNDRYPRSKRYPDSFPTTTIKRGASIGAGAIILPGLTIGENALIAAGAVVTKDVPPRALIVGNPGRIIRYLDSNASEQIS